MEYQHIRHEFDPVYDRNSEILILGTLPSVKSREQRFYYGHKQNRFWKVIATLYGEAVPVTKETGKEAEKLPSTSPANAAYQMERLLQSWKVILG